MEAMDEILNRVMDHLVGRVEGPMHLRVFLQPIMAILFACRDGYKDARDGKPAYFWALFTAPGHRRDLLKSGWKSVGKVFILALLLDVVYQYIALKWFYPLEAVVVAILLAILPYLALRGPAKRLFGLWVKKSP